MNVDDNYKRLVPYLDDDLKKALSAKKVDENQENVRFVGVRCVRKPGIEEYKKLAERLKEAHEKYGIKGHLVKAIEIPMAETVTVVKDDKPEEVTNEVKAILLSYILLDDESVKKFDEDIKNVGKSLA